MTVRRGSTEPACSCCRLSLVVGRRLVAHRRVARTPKPGRRTRHARLGVTAKAASVQQFAPGSRRSFAQPYASPTEPVDGRTPASLHRAPNAIDVRTLVAVGTTSAAVAARWPCSAHPGSSRRWAAIAQPTTRRLQASSTTARSPSTSFIGDVGHPELIGAGGAEVPIDQIRRHAGSALAVSSYRSRHGASAARSRFAPIRSPPGNSAWSGRPYTSRLRSRSPSGSASPRARADGTATHA